MTLRSSADVGFILLSGYDIMGLITDIAEKTDAVVEQSDGLGASADEYASVGVKKFDVSFDGFYDDTLTRTIEALDGEQVLMYALSGNTIGLEFTGVNAVRTTITRGPSRDSLTKAQMAFKSGEGSDVGQVSAPHATVTLVGPEKGTSDDWGTQADAVSITSSDTSDPVQITMAAVHGLNDDDTVEIAGADNADINGIFPVTVVNTTIFTILIDGSISGAGGANGTVTRTSTRDGGVGYVTCTDLVLDGGTALQITVMDSPDDITFVDHIAFTALTDIGGERKTVAGNVDRYTLTEHEFTGSAGGSRTATFACGFVRN